MKVTSITAAFVAATGIVAFGQATQPNPTTTQQPSAQTEPAAPRTPAPTTAGAAGQGQQVTISGCIVSEADYRRTQGAGGAGVAGSGVGAGNEFILANASMSTGAGATASTGSAAGAATGTSGAAGAAAGGTTMAFELSGSGEGQAAQHVGRRVEVTGMLKAAETGAAGATGGPTAGAPPRGIDVASQDLQLREIDVTSVRAATGGAPCAPAR